MNKYYFIAGEFCAEGMGRNYIGYGANFLIVSANGFNEATSIATTYAESIFGKQEYKDMWYGEMAYNWKVVPHTFDKFKSIYRDRLNLIKYHNDRAKQIFRGETLTTDEENKVFADFVKNHPVITLTENTVEPINNIEEIYGK